LEESGFAIGTAEGARMEDKVVGANGQGALDFTRKASTDFFKNNGFVLARLTR